MYSLIHRPITELAWLNYPECPLLKNPKVTFRAKLPKSLPTQTKKERITWLASLTKQDFQEELSPKSSRPRVLNLPRRRHKKERFLPKRRDAHRIAFRKEGLIFDSFPLKSLTLLSLSILYKSCTRKRDFFSKQSHLTIKQQESVALLKKLRAWNWLLPSREYFAYPERTATGLFYLWSTTPYST